MAKLSIVFQVRHPDGTWSDLPEVLNARFTHAGFVKAAEEGYVTMEVALLLQRVYGGKLTVPDLKGLVRVRSITEIFPPEYAYRTELEEEDDNRKLSHFVTLPSGKEVEVDWSPYQKMTKDEVMQWVSLGCPKRQVVGPLCQRDLDSLEANRKAQLS